jgi:hypothetical protein
MALLGSASVSLLYPNGTAAVNNISESTRQQWDFNRTTVSTWNIPKNISDGDYVLQVAGPWVDFTVPIDTRLSKYFIRLTLTIPKVLDIGVLKNIMDKVCIIQALLPFTLNSMLILAIKAPYGRCYLTISDAVNVTIVNSLGM